MNSELLEYIDEIIDLTKNSILHLVSIDYVPEAVISNLITIFEDSYLIKGKLENNNSILKED
ncbi:MAG: hypothetical protein IJB82_00025 [Bacilli bacterium]|nr:hypothetical protein [Bacilli bacterium]